MHPTSPRPVVLAIPFALLALAASPSARADDIDWARHYAEGSTGILGGGDFTLGTPYANNSQGAYTLALPVTLRFVIHHWVVQPGVRFGLTNFGDSGSSQFTFTGGVAGGYAVVLGERVAFTPMVGVELGVIHVDDASSGTDNIFDEGQGRAYVELPLQIFLARSAYLEPYVDLGVAFPFTPDGSTVFALGIGYRVGAVF